MNSLLEPEQRLRDSRIPDKKQRTKIKLCRKIRDMQALVEQLRKTVQGFRNISEGDPAPLITLNHPKTALIRNQAQSQTS